MSAATFRTSSKRSCSYRLFVNPKPVRAMPDSASLHRSRSDAEIGASSATSPNLNGGLHPPPGGLRICRIELVADVVAPRAFRGNGASAPPEKWIENQVILVGKEMDAPLGEFDGERRRMADSLGALG